MTRYLFLEQVMEIAAIACGEQPQIRDLGLLDSAVHRPQVSMFGQDAYTDLFTKAAALLQSLVSSHPLTDGNKRLAWLATTVSLRKNGVGLAPDEERSLQVRDGGGGGCRRRPRRDLVQA